MNFLNIGPSELMVILALAVLMIGPKRMVEMARTLGRATSKLRKISGEFMAIVQAELRETETGARQLVDGTVVGETGVQGEIQDTGQQAKGTLASLKEEIGLSSLQAELKATERATREFLEKIAQEEDEEEEEEAEFSGDGESSAEVAQPAPEAEVGKTPDTATPEPAQPEEGSEKEEPAALPGSDEDSPAQEAQHPAAMQEETPTAALAASQDEPAETAREEVAPSTTPAAGAGPEVQSQVVQTLPAPAQALQTQDQRQEIALEAATPQEPLVEGGSEETEAEEAGSRERGAVLEHEAGVAEELPAPAPEEALEPLVPAEDAPASADVGTREERPPSPEEKARAQEAVARAAGLMEPEQAEEEKADEDDRQE